MSPFPIAMMHSRTAALIGVNSRIGPWILDALIDSEVVDKIVILVRPTSKPIRSHPKITKRVVPSDPPTTDDLIKALADVDTTICTLNPADLDTILRLADACVLAGVSRLIPADWGSMRSNDPFVLDLLPNFRKKQRVREHCERLAEWNPDFTWTSVVTGHFFDYGLESELLGVDLEKDEARVFDGGNDVFSATTRTQIGKAVIQILHKEKETANKLLLIESFRISQQQLLEAISKVRKGTIRQIPIESRSFVEDRIAGADAGDYDATEEMVVVLGIKRSNWQRYGGGANDLLGLKEEDLDQVVKHTLQRRPHH